MESIRLNIQHSRATPTFGEHHAGIVEQVPQTGGSSLTVQPREHTAGISRLQMHVRKAPSSGISRKILLSDVF
ncbi:hypothetical protein [Mesorhizobium sp. 43Arga]